MIFNSSICTGTLTYICEHSVVEAMYIEAVQTNGIIAHASAAVRVGASSLTQELLPQLEH
jgi:hypothetical protein